MWLLVGWSPYGLEPRMKHGLNTDREKELSFVFPQFNPCLIRVPSVAKDLLFSVSPWRRSQPTLAPAPFCY